MAITFGESERAATVRERVFDSKPVAHARGSFKRDRPVIAPMQRLLRWAFNFAALSAISCVATCVMWARSYCRSDWVSRLSSSNSYFTVAATAKGQLNVAVLGPMAPWEAVAYNGKAGFNIPGYVTDDSLAQAELDDLVDQVAIHVSFQHHWHIAGFRWLSVGQGCREQQGKPVTPL